MYFDLARYISRTWPHCVSTAYTNKIYSPILLSGIVQFNKEVVSTLLPVALSFQTPYRTKDRCPNTVVFACGPNVAVNTFVGLPLFRSTGSIVDMNDNVLDITMDDEPFPS